jgi:2-keto-3-deoxy-L-rhamnonate aldolase RhmA
MGLTRPHRRVQQATQGRRDDDWRIAQPDRPVATELMARAGFDFLLIDTEHGAWDLIPLQAAVMGFNGSETVPIVRVGGTTASTIAVQR